MAKLVLKIYPSIQAKQLWEAFPQVTKFMVRDRLLWNLNPSQNSTLQYQTHANGILYITVYETDWVAYVDSQKES